jgi:hypothetical protein
VPPPMMRVRVTREWTPRLVWCERERARHCDGIGGMMGGVVETTMLAAARAHRAQLPVPFRFRFADRPLASFHFFAAYAGEWAERGTRRRTEGHGREQQIQSQSHTLTLHARYTHAAMHSYIHSSINQSSLWPLSLSFWLNWRYPNHSISPGHVPAP